MTCSRLFRARASRTILNHNLGFAESTFLVLKTINISLHKDVLKSIINEAKGQSLRKKNQASKKRKNRRHMSTVRKFLRYTDNCNDDTTYKTAIDLPFEV